MITDVKIVSISNAHQWDYVVMSRKDFEDLTYVLGLSRYKHTIKYIDLGDNSVNTMFI